MRYAHLSESRLYRHGHHWWRWSCNEIDVISWSNSNLTSWIGVECWCDFGANLVQHFIGRYSRYSRYRTKSHDKFTKSHDISRYSRYQTVLLKLQEISYFSYIQKALLCRAFLLYTVGEEFHIRPQKHVGSIWNAPLRSWTVKFPKTPLSYLLKDWFMV